MRAPSRPSLAPAGLAVGALAIAGLALAGPAAAQVGSQQLWNSPWSNHATLPSVVMTSPAMDLEAADDFDVLGAITRVVVDGSGCFGCAPPTVAGATVRFYASANGVPGQQQYETFVAAGSPALLFDPAEPETVEVTLPTPFLATGRHFVSVQLHFQGAGTWNVWVGSVGSFTHSPTQVRDRLAGGAWSQAMLPFSGLLYADLTFRLYGQLAGTSGPTPQPCWSWSELPTTMPAGANYCLLRGLRAFAPDDVWAVGSEMRPGMGQSEQLTFATHWDGVAWSQVPTPSPSPAPGLTNCILHGVDGVATNDLWAVGTWKTQVPGGWVGQQVFALQWDGAQWHVPPGLPIPGTSTGAGVGGSRALDVEAEASNDVWIVGDWIDVGARPGLLLHWDGSTLAQTLLPIVSGVGHQFFNAVAASGPNDVWVAGGAGTVATLPGSSVPVLFHFDGANWTHTPCPTPPHPGWWINLVDVQMLAGNDVWVFGIASTQMPSPTSDPFLAHWNGAAWSLLPPPPVGTTAIEVVSAGEVYAVGSSVHRFDGLSWTQSQVFTSQYGAGLIAVDALGSCSAFAVGGQHRIGQVTPFAARLDVPGQSHASLRLPSHFDRAPVTLVMVSPPVLGNTLAVAVDDPTGALGGQLGLALWMLTAAPAPGFPQPVPLPFGGRNGTAGELFVDPTTAGYTPVNAWTGSPALHGVVIPAQLALLGLDVHSQAALLGGPSQLILLSNGLDLRVGW